MIADDNGVQRYWIFVPGSGLWLVPAGVADPVAYARQRGATGLLHGTAKNRTPVPGYTLDHAHTGGSDE